jgi:hypothetical protein
MVPRRVDKGGEEMTDSKFCIWREDKNCNWWTVCGHVVRDVRKTPKDNGFKYCYFCGRELEQKEFKEEK